MVRSKTDYPARKAQSKILNFVLRGLYYTYTQKINARTTKQVEDALVKAIGELVPIFITF
jgi:hypothetical protein